MVEQIVFMLSFLYTSQGAYYICMFLYLVNLLGEGNVGQTHR